MAPRKPKIETEKRVSKPKSETQKNVYKRKVQVEDNDAVRKTFRLPDKFTLTHHETFNQEQPDILLSADNRKFCANPTVANRQSRSIKRQARIPKAGVRYVELYGISARTIGAFTDWTFGKVLQLKDDIVSDAIEIYIDSEKLGAPLFQELIIWKLCEAGRKSPQLKMKSEHVRTCYDNTKRGDALRSLIATITAFNHRRGRRMAFRSSTQTQMGSKEDREREAFCQLPKEFTFDLVEALSKPEIKDPCFEPQKYMATDVDYDDITYVNIDDAEDDAEDAATLFYS